MIHRVAVSTGLTGCFPFFAIIQDNVGHQAENNANGESESQWITYHGYDKRDDDPKKYSFNLRAFKFLNMHTSSYWYFR